MKKIKIFHDPENTYQDGEVITSDRLIEDYIDAEGECYENSWIMDAYYGHEDIDDAIETICTEWGISYQILS